MTCIWNEKNALPHPIIISIYMKNNTFREGVEITPEHPQSSQSELLRVALLGVGGGFGQI